MEEEKKDYRAELERKYQYLLDKSSPMIGARWAAFAVCLFLYMLRVWLLGAFYIVTYGLGIYLLNQFLGFISPQFDPEEEKATGYDFVDKMAKSQRGAPHTSAYRFTS